MVQSVLDGVISWKLLQHAQIDTHTTKRGLETHPTFPPYLISLFLNIILDYLKAQILRGSEQAIFYVLSLDYSILLAPFVSNSVVGSET